MYIYGGTQDTDKENKDIYEYDPATNLWTKLKPMGEIPDARDEHTADVF